MTKEEAIEIKKLYMRVFNTDDGKKVLEDLKNICFYNTTTFNPENPLNNTLYAEGMRSALLKILAQLRPIKD